LTKYQKKIKGISKPLPCPICGKKVKWSDVHIKSCIRNHIDDIAEKHNLQLTKLLDKFVNNLEVRELDYRKLVERILEQQKQINNLVNDITKWRD